MSISLCKVGATESHDHSACPYWLYCVQPRLFDWPPSNLRHGTSHHHGLKPDQIGSEWPNSILVRQGIIKRVAHFEQRMNLKKKKHTTRQYSTKKTVIHRTLRCSSQDRLAGAGLQVGFCLPLRREGAVGFVPVSVDSVPLDCTLTTAWRRRNGDTQRLGECKGEQTLFRDSPGGDFVEISASPDGNG